MKLLPIILAGGTLIIGWLVLLFSRSSGTTITPRRQKCLYCKCDLHGPHDFVCQDCLDLHQDCQ